eukprot:Amastigsp_a348753_5.p6 type:complete len:118 gc:universal Amastigsp_a348753_5:675-322(-)
MQTAARRRAADFLRPRAGEGPRCPRAQLRTAAGSPTWAVQTRPRETPRPFPPRLRASLSPSPSASTRRGVVCAACAATPRGAFCVCSAAARRTQSCLCHGTRAGRRIRRQAPRWCRA